MIPSVALERVTFTYPEAGAPVLVDVDLAVPDGTFALVIGRTGSGKSTLLRTMNGLVPHFSGGKFAGRASVAARSTLDHAPRHLADTVAFVPQDPAAAFVVDGVEDELAYAMENLGVPPDVMRRRVEEALDLLDLAPLRRRSVRTLSGGERQRVAIAAALTAGPRILLLDEPTSQLDPQGAEDVLAALQRLVHDLGMTVIAAEHRLERVAAFADVAIACLGDGRVIQGEPGDVMQRAGIGPPVARLGRMLGWDPLPLNVRDARRRAGATAPAVVPEPREPPSREAETLGGRGLAAGYGAAAVLRNVDISLRRGEIVAVMGRNGAGKTTLLRVLAGVHGAAAGSVATGEGRPPRPGVDVGLCPQEPESVLFRDSVREEVAATVAATGSGIDVNRLLARVGIAHLAARHPRDLSAGQRLLVAVAAIAATGAPVLLLDEPTRGLDAESKDLLVAFLNDHARAGGAAMVATHDVELAGELSTRVVMLAEGEVIADGDPHEVIGDSTVFAPQTARVFGKDWLTPQEVARALEPEEAAAR